MRKLLRGARLDEIPLDQVEGTWRNARNIVLKKQNGSITNEDGVDNLGVLPANKKNIGTIVLNLSKILFFGTTNPADSEFGIVDENNNYQVILKGNPLNFNENFPIEGTFENKFNGNLVISWTDNYNKIRVLNIDCIGFKVNPDGTIPVGEQAKANVLLSLFPDNLTPIINRNNVEVREGGGALLSGVYHPVFAYGFEDGSFINWSKIYNAIPVYVDDKDLALNVVGGCIGGLATDKYIELTVDNVDINFKFLKVGYLYLKNGQLSAAEVKTIIIDDNTSIKLQIYGTESSIIQLPVQDILVPGAVYERCKTMASLEKVLHLGNLKEYDDINYQTYANQIVVKWHRGYIYDGYDPVSPDLQEFLFLNFNKHERNPAFTPYTAGYKNETIVYFDKSFKSNEVYALYITFKMKNGLYSKDFHIPGRDVIAGERAVINGIKADYNDIDNGNDIYYYQCLDTSQVDGGFPREGLMGFWENENEEYPLNDAGIAVHPDFANITGITVAERKVRHHVFPSLGLQCERINLYFGYAPVSGSPGEFFFSLPSTYYTQTRVHTTVAPTDANYYHLDYAPLGGASGTSLWTYTALAAPSRARFDTFLTSGNFELQFGFNQDLSSSKVGQTVIALNGYWSIGVRVLLNGVLFSGHFLEIDNQVLIASDFPSTSFTVNVPVTGASNVIIEYEIYTSLGTATFVNPFNYTPFFATLKAKLGNYIIYGKPLGLKISNVIIPAEILPLVDSWEIKYAKRTNENLRIIAQDMLKRARFYNFDLENVKLPIKPSYLQAQLSYVLNGVVAEVNDLPESEITATTVLEIPVFDNIESVSVFQYIGENTTNIVDNANRASNIYVVAGNGQTSPLFIFVKFGTTNTLCDIVVYKRDMYKNFQEQELLSTGLNFKIEDFGVQDTQFVFGGDVHICPFGFRDSNADQYVRQYVAEFASNVMLRRDDIVLGKTYFPKNGIPSLSWYGYNRDFNCINPYNGERIHYPVRECLDTIVYHPNRVARSIPETTESKKINWRTFKANAYYDTIRNKGEIWKLTGGTRVLYIHLKYTLLKAYIKDKLATTSGEIALGYTDIFDRPPYEVLSTNEGFGGNQSQFATILCKIGYCFIDRNAGKVFVESGDKLTEISNQGLYNFFKKNAEYINKDTDNPFIGLGYTMAFDEQYNRLIITKNTYENLESEDIPFTWSFSPEINGWICEHDYLPNLLIYNRSGLYAVDNSSGQAVLFKHNSLLTKGIYYDGLKKKSYIEWVENGDKDKTKGFESISWVSTTKQGTTNVVKETITHLIVYNDTQCSGEIALSVEAGLWYNKDARNAEQTWKFNNFRDIVINPDNAFLDIKNQIIAGNLNISKEWFEQSKFISKFIIVRMIHDNQNQKEIDITLVGTNAKISNR